LKTTKTYCTSLLHILMSKLFCLAVLVCISSLSMAQKNDCSLMRDGIFYSYPKNTVEQWKSERSGNMQTEINLINQDTSIWEITWLNDCQYNMKFKSGGKQFNKETLALLKQHVFAFKIEKSSTDYYIFSQYLDKVSKTPFLTDTMWKSAKNIVSDNRIFKLTTQQEIKKARFKDTSQYALLYVYRPSKFVCSQIYYMVHADDIPMCIMKSKSAYVFKILREGPLELKAYNKNKGTQEKPDIKFGHKYYLNCDINWSADRCIPNISIVEEAKGLTGYLEAQ
jgi:hypothetical protein